MRYLALLMGLLAAPSYALTQVDIFSAEVAINSEQKEPERAARNEGMQQVLVRATGQTNVAANETVQKAMRQSAQYLSQMSFGEASEQTTLRMRFNGAQIRNLLTQAQLPYWPETRSNVLVWLVEEQNYDKTIVWEHSSSELAAGIQKNAKVRGLPITLPVGDFDDITGIATSDLWGGFVSPISQASQRYPVDAVLVVRAQPSGLRWTLYDQQPNQLTSAPKSPVTGSISGSGESASQSLVNEISNYYAAKSAVTVASESSESILAQFISLDNVTLAIAWAVPLLLPLPGILAGKPYTHAWANFILMLYFLHALTILYVDGGERMFAAVELLLTTIGFAGNILFTRFRAKELGIKLKRLSEVEKKERAKFEQ